MSECAGPAEDLEYVECPVDGCGEVLLLQELDYHLELHSDEAGEPLPEAPTPAPDSGTDPGTEAHPPATGPSRAHRETERHRQPDHDAKNDRQAKAISAWKRLLKMPSVSSAHWILSSKRPHEDKQTSAGHSARGKRLGVSGHGSDPSHSARLTSARIFAEGTTREVRS